MSNRNSCTPPIVPEGRCDHGPSSLMISRRCLPCKWALPERRTIYVNSAIVDQLILVKCSRSSALWPHRGLDAEATESVPGTPQYCHSAPQASSVPGIAGLDSTPLDSPLVHLSTLSRQGAPKHSASIVYRIVRLFSLEWRRLFKRTGA